MKMMIPIACPGSSRKGCSPMPSLIRMALMSPSCSKRLPHRKEVTANESMTGTKNAQRKKVFALIFVLRMSASPRATHSCTGTVMTTNTIVFPKAFHKNPSLNALTNWSNPTKCTSSSRSRYASVKEYESDITMGAMTKMHPSTNAGRTKQSPTMVLSFL